MTGYSTFGGRGGGRGGRGGRGRGGGSGGKGGRGGSGVKPSWAQLGSDAGNAPVATSATGSGPPAPKRHKTGDGFDPIPTVDPLSTIDPFSIDQLPPSSPLNQGTLPSGTSNLGGPAQTGDANKKSPAQSPFASKDGSDLIGTGVFNLFGGSRMEDLEDLFNDGTILTETPSKTSKHTIEQLQELVKMALTDVELLDKLRGRVETARAGQTKEQRKEQLRKDVEPWFQTGLNYTGSKQQGLFLEDGTRNPKRPLKGSGSRPPLEIKPGAATAGPGRPPPKAGKPSSDPVTAPTGPKALPSL